MSRSIVGFEDAEAVARHAAVEFVRLGRAAIDARGTFNVALAGGATPRRTYELLGQPPLSRRLDWGSVHIFFGDERSVAPDHKDSNFNTARTALLNHISVPEGQIHRMAGERGDLTLAAREYAAVLARVFRTQGGAEIPRFDLVLLGMGKDGHTASLFPYTTALDETRLFVVKNYVPSQQTERITMTAPIINAARNVVFLVAGGDKAEALERVLEGPRDPTQFPSQLVSPTDGDLEWLVDQAAAARLSKRPMDPSDWRLRS